MENTLCCSGATGNQREAFSDISRALAVVFHDVDLVPSDIAAGLILLNREQSQKAQEEQEMSKVSWEFYEPLAKIYMKCRY